MRSMEDAVRRANVVYDLDSFQTGWPHVPPYVSSGILGGCFGIHGFMDHPQHRAPEGRTVLGYTDHYFRVEHGRHIQLALAVIRAEFADGTGLNLMDCTRYRQELDLLTATLTTDYDLYGPTTVTAFASQTVPNLFVMRIARQPAEEGKELIVTVDCDTAALEKGRWPASGSPARAELRPAADGVRVASRTNCLTTDWVLSVDGGEVTTEGSAVSIVPSEPVCTLRILVEREGCPGREVRAQPWERLHGEHLAAMRRFWEECWADYPEERAHKVWTRTNYYLACNFPTRPARPMCPEGVLSNVFPFYFPQDVYYVAENVPRLNHLERARTALRYWLDHLPDVQDYCRDVMGVEGAYYPWTPPYQDWDEYERDGVCNPDSYELHNSVYVVAMIWHYYLLSGDGEFLGRFLPVLQEVFRFYWNISSRNASGTFDTYHEHARGQDEHSTTAGDLRDVLCAGYSAEYTARAFSRAAGITGEGDPEMVRAGRQAVESGYERDSLLRPEGFYTTYEGDDRPIGSQKHPVQLNPIAFLPMPDMVEPGSPPWRAWRRRYDLCDQAKTPRTKGWTFGEYFLSSVRMRAPGEAERDLWAARTCRAGDPRWTQFYEGSSLEGWHLWRAYYFTMSGLYLQGFTDTLVQDWRGYLDLFACLLAGWAEKEFAFHGFRVRGGVVVSGQWHDGSFRVTLAPGAAKTVRVRVSRPGITVAAEGQASGPARFNAREVVEFEFNDDVPIVLSGPG